ncbi:thiol reductant ABC exporter subunit CydC [uncultured Reyranella sp.]|uniref:thiol reductant ABC exporter subunit CydC n=1 Tax=uncultured Reyranella sp. TaxID=735512 RepID=UPI00259D1C3F|nr:thiol reductant ABC exporter subunit CydC [uncultured Reyranella sp.]
MSDWTVLRRLLALAWPWRGWMSLSVLVACATVLASVALMGVAGWFIAAMGIAGVTTGMMNYFLPSAGIRFFAIVRTGGRYADRLLSHEATFRLLAGLRLWLFRKLVPLSPGQLQSRRGGDLAGSLQADVDTLQHAYLRLASPVAVALVCGVAVVATVAVLHPPTAVLLAVLLVVAGLAAPALARRAAAAPGADAVASRADLRVAAVDLLQGLADLRAAGAVERHLVVLDGLGDRLVGNQCRAATAGVVAEAAVGLSAGLALWGAALLAAASVAAGFAPALVPALALVALAAFEAIAPLPAAMERWGEVSAAARRIFELADQSPTIVAGPAPSPVPHDASVVFSSVRLRYAPDLPPALDGFDLEIEDGDHLAILGPSGAGKSSIARLLLRFWEYEGEIRLGGHDLRCYQPNELRRMVGVATQDAQLFNGTIRDNLLMAAPDADTAAMDRVLEIVQLGPFVRGLPDGIDTWIGEAGARLSAGQARRLVIARALLRNPRLLIVDEPTENLDAATAARLLAALREETANRTVILITHDPRAASLFTDRIVQMQAGRIVR